MKDKSNWRERARCLGVNPDMFDVMPSETRRLERAREFCGGCPVREQCLEDALSTDNQMMHKWSMIRGGLTASERKSILKKRAVPRVKRQPGEIAIVRRKK